MKSRSALMTALLLGATSAAFAFVTCAGILGERLSSGSIGVGLVVNVFVTLAALLLLALLQRRAESARTAIVPQVVGALVAIAGVHFALRLGVVAAPPWLSEEAPQLVNDVVAVFTTLAVVWACARGSRVGPLVAALTVLTLYRVTARFWHLDAAPHGFAVTVQDFVLVHFVAAALALIVYRGMTQRERAA